MVLIWLVALQIMGDPKDVKGKGQYHSWSEPDTSCYWGY